MAKIISAASDFFTEVMKYRLLGILVVAGTIVLSGFATWIWWEAAYYRSHYFCIYLESGAEGLSLGGDVLFDGFKIGQIREICLENVKTPAGTRDFARVELTIDSSLAGERFAFPSNKMSREEQELYIAAMVQEGLRARVVLPSLTASSFAVELLFRPKSIPQWVLNPRTDIPPELPTIKSFNLQTALLELSNYIGGGEADKISKKINGISQILESSIREIKSVDFVDFAKKINAFNKTVTVDKIEELLPKIEELNQDLLKINGKFQKGDFVGPEDLAAVNSRLRELRAENEAFGELIDAIQIFADEFANPVFLNDLKSEARHLQGEEN
ncbi:MAG: hypothetical protein K6B46_03435 [Opitutales bacterium]|nr:hypothetical protein [Opitutales bacterium]